MSIDHTADAHAEDLHVAHVETGHDDHTGTTDNAHGLTDMGYVKVAILLAVMTGLEVGLSYAGLPGGLFMGLLLGLMVLKFWTVVSYFMHLKFDNKLFSRLFYSGLFLAIFVFVVALCTFQFFAGR